MQISPKKIIPERLPMSRLEPTADLSSNSELEASKIVLQFDSTIENSFDAGSERSYDQPNIQATLEDSGSPHNLVAKKKKKKKSKKVKVEANVSIEIDPLEAEAMALANAIAEVEIEVTEPI